MEYYSELVSLLARLLRDARVSARRRLQCARAVLALLAAAPALQVDPAAFHEHLYGALLELHAGAALDRARAALDAAHLVAQRGRHASTTLLRAFAKRVATTTLQTPHHCAAALLAVLRLLLGPLPRGALLEPDADEGARHRPLLAAPEHCGAEGARAHELAALRRHYHAPVRAAAAAVLAGAAPQPAVANL